MDNIYNLVQGQTIKLKLLCHTTHLGKKQKRYFKKGKEYEVDFYKPYNSSGGCIMVWVIFNTQDNEYIVTTGEGFMVHGNVYEDGKPKYINFKKVFHCPMDKLRTEKIKRIKHKMKR
jgi:hypothetical protein